MKDVDKMKDIEDLTDMLDELVNTILDDIADAKRQALINMAIGGLATLVVTTVVVLGFTYFL